MVTADLGACESYVNELRRSSLVDRGQIEQLVGDFLKKSPRGQPEQLGDYLVKQGVLTDFQSKRILEGKAQGLVLGPYVLTDSIGSGSMGTVYKAINKTDNQHYAVKVLPRRSMWNVRLARRQVRAFGSFQHPSVIPFVDVGTSGGAHYLVWPLAQGETLEATVQKAGKLAPGMAALYCLQAAHGLSASHAQGLFHGLIKPSNILIGSDHQARIMDYGIGSLLVENEGESLVDTMSTSNTFASGLDCASPESIMEPTNRTPAGDQYSLGCVLYFCLTGKYPFPEGSAVEKMMAHQTKTPPPIKELSPEVPDGLVAIADKLMAKAPEGRYTGADEVVEALQAFATELPQAAKVAAPAAPQLPTRASIGSKPAAEAAPTSSPPSGGAKVMPTRASFKEKADAVPPPPAAPHPAASPAAKENYNLPPGYVPEQKPPSSPNMIILVVLLAVVAGAAYFLFTKFGGP